MISKRFSRWKIREAKRRVQKPFKFELVFKNTTLRGAIGQKRPFRGGIGQKEPFGNLMPNYYFTTLWEAPCESPETYKQPVGLFFPRNRRNKSKKWHGHGHEKASEMLMQGAAVVALSCSGYLAKSGRMGSALQAGVRSPVRLAHCSRILSARAFMRTLARTRPRGQALTIARGRASLRTRRRRGATRH